MFGIGGIGSFWGLSGMTDTQDISSAARPSGRRRSDRIVGASPAIKQSVDRATRAARLNSPILVTGPAGSGRVHLARSIHAWSARAGAALSVFSGSATPQDQQQSELFGVVSTAADKVSPQMPVRNVSEDCVSLISLI